MPDKKSKPCHCCGGSGAEHDPVKDGRSLSGLRLRAGVTLRGLARSLGISYTYLWQIEKGQRRCPPGLKAKYLKFVLVK